MPRSANRVASRRRRKKVLKQAKGNYAGRRKLFQNAKETVKKGLAYAYRDRKNRKREFRRLWIARISAAAKLNGISYSRFMSGLRKAEVDLDRKVLSDIAIRRPDDFPKHVEKARENA